MGGRKEIKRVVVMCVVWSLEVKKEKSERNKRKEKINNNTNNRWKTIGC